MLHTWSLAVEEQFYILFPLLLLFLMRRRKSFPIGILAVIALISFLVTLWAARAWPNAAFYLTPFRAWELLAGSLCGLYLLKNGKTDNSLAAGIGVGLILLSVFFLNSQVPFPSEYTVAPILGTVLIILFASPANRTGQILSWSPIVGIGLISYSAYLWHQPILALTSIRLKESPGLAFTIALIALTFVLAYLSWRFVETPIRKAKSLKGMVAEWIGKRSVVFAGSAVVAAALSGFALYGITQKGFAASFDKVNIAGYRWDNMALQQQSWAILRTNSKHRGVTGDPYEQTLWYSDPGKKNVLLVGNSHSTDIFNTLFHTQSVGGHFELARYGVNFSTLDANHKLYEAPNYKEADYVFVATKIFERDIAILPKVIEKFQSDNKSVVIMANAPEFSGDQVVTPADEIILPKLMFETDPDLSEIAHQVNHHYWQDLKGPQQLEINDLNSKIHAIAQRMNVPVVSRFAYICDNTEQRCDIVDDQLTKHFYDQDHNTMEGARFYAKRIDQLDLFGDVFKN